MQNPAVIVINSLVARGAVGGRASVFILERLGFPVWSAPTLVLPWHLGHGRATRIIPPAEEFERLLADLAGAPRLSEVGCIVTGYFGSVAQVGPTARLIEAVMDANPAAHYLCDPIIGDSQGLFQPEAVAVAIRDTLLPLADFATPNRFELDWLTGMRTNDNAGLIAAARELTPHEVVVTSAFAGDGRIGNLHVARDRVALVSHPLLPDVPHGTGDALAALFLAHRLRGLSGDAALVSAVSSTLRLIELARDLGTDEMPLAAGQDAFLAAPHGVTVEHLERRG